MAADADLVTIDRREPSVDRALMRRGIRDDTARIVAATPSMRASWLLAATSAALFAVWGAHADAHVLSVVSILAPVLPVVGVAAAYGPERVESLGGSLEVRSVRGAGTTISATIPLPQH